MKLRLLISIATGILLLHWGLSGSSPDAPEEPSSGDPAVKAWYRGQTDTLLTLLDQLDAAAAGQAPLSSLHLLFAECRFRYKKSEAITEYYFGGLTKRINGPALPDVSIADGRVLPPHGFGVIEELLHDGYDDSLQGRLSEQIRQLQTDLRFVQANMAHHTISPAHMSELVQHGLIRIAVLGIAGFDAPLSGLALPETRHSLLGLQELASRYTGSKIAGQQAGNLFAGALRYLSAHTDFDAFDRLEFLCGYLMPLSDALARIPGLASQSAGAIIKPFSGGLRALFNGSGFYADYYAPYAIAKSNAAKVALGRKLFSDTRLSRSGTVSCRSCHQPERYFTDGLAKAGGFVHGGAPSRNTPTLLYAALQSHQFYDLRSMSLEDQADQVMSSRSEFDCPADVIAGKIAADKTYLLLFRPAFGSDSLDGYKVRNALAAFVRSLSPFSSRFDAYIQGDKSALTQEEVRGFNLFSGKAKCGTCHFAPLFNGNIPPQFTRSESEIIGVPERAVWQRASLDPDSGRYLVNRLPALTFSFKTPTVRNSEKTAPYMHNGVYKTLDDVVEFYHKGGGAGLGMILPGQSLPFDSLALNAAEKRAVVRFMESLTDRPVELP